MGRINPEKLKPAQLANYIKWLETPSLQHTVGVGNGKAKGQSGIVYIIPFNVQVPANFYAKSSCTTAAYTALQTEVAGYVLNQLAAPNVAERLEQFSAARVVRRTGKAAKGTAKTSHITGDQYNSYGGSGLSVPFGKDSAASEETELGIFDLILAKFKTGSPPTLPAGTEVTLTKEKFTERTA